MKESCTNCRYFYTKRGNLNWVQMYYCTVDGKDEFLGEFDNYTGWATNHALIELGHRCCRFFKEKERDTNE